MRRRNARFFDYFQKMKQCQQKHEDDQVINPSFFNTRIAK